MQDFATGKAALGSALHQLTRLFKSRKAVRIMKLTGILLLAGCLQLSAMGITQTVSISVKDAPLLSVLKAIEKQTDYVFFVNSKDLQKANKISITVNNIPLQQVLDLCFKNQPLTYAITGKVITVSLKEEKARHDNSLNQSPPQDIKGKVINEKGEPVLATIQVKGTDKGTTTNDDGEFQLQDVADDAVLVISGVGLETKELKFSGKSFLVVTLNISVSPLQETIIKGYYTTTRTLNTGNVTKVKGEDITKQPVTDPLLALQGRVPGFYIAQSSGVPGSISSFQLRGQNSIANGNNPLFIIDGVPFTSDPLTNLSFGGGGGSQKSPFALINPSDIESIEVLKDADATAIYGSRAANGVVLITTKKGKSGKTKVDINLYSGRGKVTRTMDLLNTQQYLTMRREAIDNDGYSSYLSDPSFNSYWPDLTIWDTSRYTNWQKVFLGNTAKLNNAEASISGGNSNTQFLFSTGYTKQTTVFPGSSSEQRTTLHISLNHLSTNKKFGFNFSSNYTNTYSDLPQIDFSIYTRLAPNAPKLFDSLGNLNWENDSWSNPNAELLRKYKTITKNLLANAVISYSILPGLSIKSLFGYNDLRNDETITTPLTSFSPSFSNEPQRRMSQFGNNTISTWNIEPQINFTRKIFKGVLNTTAGATFSERLNTSLSQRATNFSSDALLENIQAASSVLILQYLNTNYRYNSVFGRVNYNWDNKYLLNLTGRIDGSSRFGPGKQFGQFGAVGIGWIFSNEKFFQQSQVLSYGKLRGSIGTTGNEPSTDYKFLSTYSSNNYPYLGLSGLFPTGFSNPNFRWETVRKIELGIELGFIKNKILLNASYYRNKTNNQILSSPLPSITGGNSILENLPATLQNTGIEIELTTYNLNKTKLQWSTSVNVTIPKNKLVSYPNLDKSPFANTYVVGQSLYIRKLFQFVGVDPATGLMQFASSNGPTISPSNPEDLNVTRKVGQDYFGGLQNTIKYGNWSLDFLVQFVKQTGTNYLYSFGLPGAFGTLANQPTIVLNRWQKTGQITNIQKFSSFSSDAATAYANAVNSDYAISDASFIRLKTFSLSYNIPIKWISKAYMQNARVYVEGQNLFTITKYLGYDPESQGSFSTPPLRMFVAGIQLTF